MTTNAPSDDGSKSEHLKDKLKHPFEHMREKFQDSKLYEVKAALSHKK
jgi:phospholipase D1/2